MSYWFQAFVLILWLFLERRQTKMIHSSILRRTFKISLSIWIELISNKDNCHLSCLSAEQWSGKIFWFVQKLTVHVLFRSWQWIIFLMTALKKQILSCEQCHIWYMLSSVAINHWTNHICKQAYCSASIHPHICHKFVKFICHICQICPLHPQSWWMDEKEFCSGTTLTNSSDPSQAARGTW